MTAPSTPENVSLHLQDLRGKPKGVMFALLLRSARW